MWQRIQTLYLALATGLVVAMFFCDKTEGVSFVAYFPYLILMIIVALLDFLALTTWKFRVFQMRTAVLCAIITLAFQGWLAVDFVLTHKDVAFRLPVVFPAVAAILDLLAARSIMADEMIVRNASRLRAAKRK